MAIIAGIADFEVARRNDFGLRLTFKDSTSSPIDLTGYTVEAEAWSLNESGRRDAKYADWAVTYTNRSSGIVNIKLTDTQTATFTPSELFYDVQLTEPSGNKNQYIKGTLFIVEGVTE